MRALLLVLLLFPYVAFAGGRQEVKREDFGDAWPFTVDKGVVTCRAAGSVLFVTDRGIYAVNGLAISDGRYENIKDIWRDNPDRGSYGPEKVSIGPIIDLGLSLCDWGVSPSIDLIQAGGMASAAIVAVMALLRRSQRD